METIIVTTTEELWKAAQSLGRYAMSTIDSTLEDVGFIHATTPQQVIPMLNRRFQGRGDILLLLVDLDKIAPEVKFEQPQSGRAGLFPHIYGALNLDAVYGTLQPGKDDTGNFVESPELVELAAQSEANRRTV